MNCACEWDAEGKVIGCCAAHWEYIRWLGKPMVLDGTSTPLESEIQRAMDWLQQLQRDLRTKRAKEISTQFGHVYRHLWNEQKAPSITLQSGLDIEMMTRTECVDLLKLWGFYLHIATCPRTGTRFVEDLMVVEK